MSIKFKLFEFGNRSSQIRKKITDDLNIFAENHNIIKTEVASNGNDGAVMFVTYEEKVTSKTVEKVKKSE